MHYMNEYEIDRDRNRYANHPVLGRATKLLFNLKELVNGCSDGWCYWGPPVRSADKLMTLIEHPETATEELFKKAQTPIKSFCTRHKLQFPGV